MCINLCDSDSGQLIIIPFMNKIVKNTKTTFK